MDLTPIGQVRNEVKTPALGGWGQVESDLVLEERYSEAMDGIEDYSHVLVVFWIDRSEPQPTKGHVQRREELPVVGVFAGRRPGHPNPIGVTAVKIMGRRGNVLRVRGLDAIDGTPLLDVKPYTPAFDRVEDARVPDRCTLIYEKEDYF